MSAYPSGVYSPRTKENKSGVVYVAGKSTVGFAEDITKLDDEVVAIETELGANPKGAKTDVKTRLDDVDEKISEREMCVKYSDETVNNTTTLQDDNELLIPVGYNEGWMFDVTLFFDTGTTPNIKIAFSGPTGTTALWSFVDSSSNVTKTIAESSFRVGGGAGSKRACHIKAFFWLAGVSGNIRVKWAQNTADASNTKVLTGSNIIAHRLISYD